MTCTPPQPPIVFVIRDAEVDRAVGLIGHTALDEALNQRDHLGNVPRGTGVFFGPLDLEHVEGSEERIHVGLRELIEIDPSLGGFGDDFVVDIGDIHDLEDAETEVLERPPEEILEDEGAEITDVSMVVDRRPAGIDPDLTHYPGLQGPQGAPHGVVEDRCEHVSRRLLNGDRSADPGNSALPVAAGVEGGIVAESDARLTGSSGGELDREMQP